MGHGAGMRVALSSFVVVVVVFAGFVAGCPQQVSGEDAGVVDSGVDVPVACADDEECNGGFCRAGVCVAEQCRDKSECGAGQVCSAAGACTAPPATCTSPADCPGTFLCDGFTRACFDPNEGEGEEGEGDVPVGEGEGDGDGDEDEDEGTVGEGEGDVPVGIDVSGYRLENEENAQTTVIPAGIVLDVGDVLVIGRKASQQAFTTFWGSFGAGAQYLNANTDNGVPVINGNETFSLIAPGGVVVDGPTREGASKKCYARTAADASADGSWTEAAGDAATPGTATVPGVHGLTITEWCDADGSGNFVFEFIEIANLP